MARSALKNIAKMIDDYVEGVTVADSFLHDLKNSIEQTDAKNQVKPSPTFKPSSMNCVRASYYSITEVEPDPSDTSYTLVGICNSGSDIHARIQTAIADMCSNGYDCQFIDVGEFVKSRDLKLEVRGLQGNETKLYDPELNVSFLCDGIVCYNHKYYIVELKTENSFKWMNREQVDESHHRQAITYSLELGLDNVIFIYINRDNLDMKSYLFEVTDEMKQAVLGYISNCNQYIVARKLPPRVPISKKACTYCIYKDRCSRDGD